MEVDNTSKEAQIMMVYKVCSQWETTNLTTPANPPTI